MNHYTILQITLLNPIAFIHMIQIKDALDKGEVYA